MPRATRRLVALVLCCASAGCGATQQAPVPAAAGGRLVIAVAAEPRSLNVLFTEGPTSAMLVPLLYSYLVTLDGAGRLEPDLALRVPSLANGGVSRDGRTITYELRHDARFSDGRPLTAADVVFTYRRIVDPRTSVFSRFGYDRVRSIAALGPYRVRVRLAAPFSVFLTNFFGPAGNYGVLPAHLLRGVDDLDHAAFNARPVGSGPFAVREWVRGDHVTLVRNRFYFHGSPHLSELVLRFVPISSTVVTLLRTGEANAYFFSDPAHGAEYGALPALRVERAPFAAFGDLVFNLRDSAVSDLAVRRALVSALDVPRIVRTATRATQSSGDAYRALFGFTATALAPPHHDSGAARRALAVRRLRLDLVYESGKAVSESVAVQVQQQLRDAGVEVVLHAFTPTQFRAPASEGGPLFSGRFALAFFEIFTSGDWDASWYLGCSQMPPNGFNVGRFCDRRAQAAEDAVLASYDPAAQARASLAVQLRANTELPFVSLWSERALYVLPRDLRGFDPGFDSPYANAWRWRLQ